MQKPRRIDYYPDDFLAGVAGKLTPVDMATYWMICTLQYSQGDTIDDDPTWISRLFADTHWWTIRASIDRLVIAGKVVREGSKIGVKRAARELQDARRRLASSVQNGRKGGRPSTESDTSEKQPVIFPKTLPSPSPSPNIKPPTPLQGEVPDFGFALSPDDQMTNGGQKPNTPPSAKASTEHPAFAEFWKAYPSRSPHTNPRKPAAVQFGKAVKAGTDPTTISTGARNYALAVVNNHTDPQFIPMASTWLSQNRWEEHQQPPVPMRRDDGMC